ncbi:acyltransferase family protein [Zobellia russellii]|uniref:acyltransferase family protein n=1 Tax=Zobellia russellii TaxID=248907 RepID=UPI001BFF5512|nr:acyltransferase [Zobellia russellii]MBT9187520.1 acyltransferase [Zobellia russellii]
MFLKSISNFRGLAILLIVAGHLYVFGLSGADILSTFVRNLMGSGTSFFVFVSGFMFHHVYYKRYGFRQFMSKKFKNVALPYLILGTIAVVFFLITSYGYFAPVNQLSSEEFSNLYEVGIFKPSDTTFMTILKYYYTGRISTIYWYIPFAMLLFLCSPLHMAFIRLKLKEQLSILVLLYVLALFVHRPLLNLNPFHSLFYFTPMYLIGVLTSLYSTNIKRFLDNKLLLMLVVIIGLSLIQQLLGHEGAYNKYFFEYGGVDLQLIQKTICVFFLFVALEKYTFKWKILDVISETSFAIYFLHPWLIYVLKKVYTKIGILPDDGNNNILLYLFSLLLVTFLSTASALMIKRLFKHSSKTRYIIGY